MDGGYKGPRAKVEGVETWYGLGCSVLLFSISTTPSCSTSARESIVQSKPANAVLQLAEDAAAGHREPKKAARLVDARGSHTGSQVLLRCFKVEKGLQRKEDYHGLLRLLCPQCSAKVIPLSSLINLRSQSLAKVIFPNLPLSLSLRPSCSFHCLELLQKPGASSLQSLGPESCILRSGRNTSSSQKIPTNEAGSLLLFAGEHVHLGIASPNPEGLRA